MKNFEQTIKTYLDEYAAGDATFAEKMQNPKKSISECCRYIIGEAGAKREKNSNVVAVAERQHHYPPAVECEGNKRRGNSNAPLRFYK